MCFGANEFASSIVLTCLEIGWAQKKKKMKKAKSISLSSSMASKAFKFCNNLEMST